MFKLEMKKYLLVNYNNQRSCKRVTIYKEIELPFAPSVGLIISDSGFENKISILYWHNELKKFIAEFEDDNEKYVSWARTLEEALESELSCGWQIDR